MRIGRRAVSGLALACLVLTAGCTPSGAQTPDDWTRVEEGAVSVAVPEGWVPVDGISDVWTTGWADDADDPTVTLLVAPALEATDAANGRDLFQIGWQLGDTGYISESGPDADPAGDLDMARNDFSWGAESDQPGVMWSAAVPGTRPVVAVLLRSMTANDLPDDLVSGVERSIDVTAEGDS